MPKSSILILGSARRDGNTRKAVDWISSHADSPVVDLNDYAIGYFDYEFRNQHDDFLPLFEDLLAYDTLIFATPVYWYSMSAVMKTFFDRLTDVLDLKPELGEQLAGKHMMLVACSGHEKLQDWFSNPFTATAEYLQMHFSGEVHVWLEKGAIAPKALKGLEAFIKQIPQ